MSFCFGLGTSILILARVMDLHRLKGYQRLGYVRSFQHHSILDDASVENKMCFFETFTVTTLCGEEK